MTQAEEIYHRFIRYEWNEISEGMKKSILEAINEALKNKISDKIINRYFLTSFSGEGNGSIWFESEGLNFPSNIKIKEAIKSKFPQVKNPIIIHIQEFNEEDYNNFK